MVNWTTYKALKPEKPIETLARRNPAFYSQYVGEEDEFGFDLETFAFWEHVFRYFYEDYFKVTFDGIDNIPSEGRAIICGNHSGLLPADGAMLVIAICNLHPSPRRLRFLATDWFFTVPGLREWAQKTGQVRATLENAETLLSRNELIGIYPEGIRGVGKTFRERYRVHDFHPGFVKLAIATQTPLVPVATVGGDEIFPNFVNNKTFGQLLRMPYFPTTLTFPWLPFPMPFFPLPVRWMMKIHKPINLGYPPEKATDRKLVLRIAREIQYLIQRDLNDLLRQRKSLFSGWDEED